MRGIIRMITGAILSLLVLNAPAIGGESCKLGGVWDFVAFYTEDVATKGRVQIYGEHPSGSMTMKCNGHFSAWVGTAQTEPVLSIWDDVARSLGLVQYSGSYRLDGNKIIISNNKAPHKTRANYDAFDLTWSEAKSQSDDVRSVLLIRKWTIGDIMMIETPPMPGPSGASNMIIGRVILERKLIERPN